MNIQTETDAFGVRLGAHLKSKTAPSSSEHFGTNSFHTGKTEQNKTPVVKMSSDQDNVVVPLMWQFLLNCESSKNKLWMHEINKKKTVRK
ncbi:Hypothetical protein CINCED_3A013618 [Cinara cedri]|uniref:Uncharacterized protein n=1 Tax=Cinara cedri TaxID=506608 RepID=A0A5E4MDQ7_9HEMI|nr:Hypothetical protein CINCED_3A013618 [Cinara cedri]